MFYTLLVTACLYTLVYSECGAYCTDCKNGTCRVCNERFLNIEGKCIYYKYVIPNCQIYSGECVLCNYGFVLNNGSCIEVNLPNCVEYDQAGTCTQCVIGYFINNKGFCQSCPANCIECMNDKCLVCADKYYLVNETCTKGNIKNCLRYNSLGNCDTCSFGYGVKNGMCEFCRVKDCQDCSLYDDCLLCNGGSKQLFNNSCQNFIPIENCKKYDIDFAKCLECEKGYYLEHSQCFSCPLHCAYCNSNHCNQCNDGYFHDGKTCSRCFLKNCVKCSSSDACEKCKDGYYIYNNTCRKKIEHCKKEHGLKCVECNEGFYLTTDTCIKGVAHCLIHKSHDQCFQCSPGYFLTENYLCSQCHSSCKTCEGSASFCSSCYSGFIGKDSKCFTCMDKFCSKCTIDRTYCVECESDAYENHNGVCMSCQRDCIQCDGYSHCIYCYNDNQNKTNYSQDGICLVQENDKKGYDWKLILVACIGIIVTFMVLIGAFIFFNNKYPNWIGNCLRKNNLKYSALPSK
ncbi:CXXC-rich, putative [Entamoeba histolytica HM-1:IMSS-B]|uniref:CXXC-rich protein n=6 Tax=Entamoeba histolytica TaxID=5759 RepID=C4LV72_ENTH1|nr:CXXC-rich protein [Entamoeba histolytica HM-1:IMSS]EMD48085.1 CXXC-rich protein, putative [Entamoeba histolytica KU27]EMH75376.1 CXXC-rich, putative [Entamoeba histolytica HM-1:IMSS-B]EMS16852.1 CXXC-rich protein [Entamoeba histolytica HM-3:IMSS]ENY64147.1 CXXC-rich protein, putative [Entamoeba histolytica HM-1:IMSS-A]GAT92557.1 cxxc-rich protein [Entamoeba histolytica]|eukprot:XP_655161.1 CXXC-rich protein [Entamoeba histolytica HM-1:IMSS]